MMESIPIFLQNVRHNRTAQHFSYFLGAFWFLLLMGAIIFIPRWHHLYRTNQDWRRLQETLRSEEQEEQVLANWNWPEVEKRAQLAYQAFPQKNDIQLILFALEEPSRRNNFMIERLGFDVGTIETASLAAQSDAVSKRGVKIRKKPDTVAIDFSVLGPAANLVPLLEDLEKSLPLISISEFSFYRQKKGKQESLSNVHFKLKMYFAGVLPKVSGKSRFQAKDFLLSNKEMKIVATLREFYSRSKLLFQKMQLIKEKANVTSLSIRQNPFVAAPTP